MRRRATAAFAAILLVSVPAFGQSVAVVTTSTSERAEAAVRYLARQIDYPVVRRTPAADSARTEALLQEARRDWREDLIVVLDVEGAVVRVLRPGDGTVASRTLDPRAGSAPYAISLAAAELLELVKDAPPARAASLPRGGVVRGGGGSDFRPTVWGGALLSVSENADVQLIQPILGAEARFGRYPDALWYGFGINVAGLVGMRRSQYLVLPEGPDEDASVHYQRTQVALRSSLGHRQGASRAAAFLDLGTARIGVESRDASGDTVREASRWTVFAGLGGELEYALGRGFFIGFGGGVAWFPAPQRFWATPAGEGAQIMAFQEARLEFRAQPAVLVWEGP